MSHKSDLIAEDILGYLKAQEEKKPSAFHHLRQRG